MIARFSLNWWTRKRSEDENGQKQYAARRPDEGFEAHAREDARDFDLISDAIYHNRTVYETRILSLVDGAVGARGTSRRAADARHEEKPWVSRSMCWSSRHSQMTCF